MREDYMSEIQAQRLIEWVLAQGMSREKANEALAHVMGASPSPNKKEGPHTLTKSN